MFRQSKIALAACACLALLSGYAVAADTVSRPMEKPLKAAQDAMNAKKLDEALAKLREAQALPNKSAYDQFVINEFLGPIYAQQGKYAESFDAFSANVDSPYLTAKAARYKVLYQLSYQLKNYPGAIEYGNRAIQAGDESDDIRLIVAQSYYLQSKWKDAATALQDLVARAERSGKHPAEQSLLLLNQCYQKLGDESGQARIIEKLVTYSPKPEYWALAMASLKQMVSKDDRLTLQVYRLMADVGTLKRSDQYAEMAQLAVEQGFPGEAQSVLEQGIAKGVFTEQRDKERNERLLESSKKLVATERTSLPKVVVEATAAPNGELLVAAGSSYLMNLGDPAKAVTLITQGIAKGSLKSLNNAYIMLGLANARAKNTAEAEKAFAKVDKSEAYERLAKLWTLRVR
jgi:Tfp pilus assembly protein PilF